MKTRRLLFALMIAWSLPVMAQHAPDSGSAKKRETHKRLMDENGDGVQDKKMKRGKDRFVDANGDGICDSREQGLGFRRGKSDQRTMLGKQTGKQLRGKK